MSHLKEVVVGSDDNENKNSEEGFLDNGKAEHKAIKIKSIEQK